jgi:hypothetical protein
MKEDGDRALYTGVDVRHLAVFDGDALSWMGVFGWDGDHGV